MSLVEDRHKQALKFWRIWKDLHLGRHPENWTSDNVEQGKIRALCKIADLCQTEIIEAVLGNLIGARLLGFRCKREGARVLVTGNSALMFGSVRQAAESVASYRLGPIHKHVKACMSEVLARATANFNEWFHNADAEQLLVVSA